MTTRWRDNDIYGHINNVVYYEYFDSAVNGWLIDQGLLDLEKGPVLGLVVDTACSYFAPIAFPDRIDAGVGVARIGTTSVTYSIGLFRNQDNLASAQGRFTHAYVDRETRRPVPLPPEWREALGAIALREEG